MLKGLWKRCWTPKFLCSRLRSAGMIRTRRGQGTTQIELLDNGSEPVSGLEMLDLTMWFSGVQIPAGGIASVYTGEAFRNRGYARQCMEHALELQRREGKPLSFLFGIPRFYEPFGYTTVMAWYAVHVSTESLRELPPEPEMREFTPQHEQAVMDTYQAAVRMRIGPLVRDLSMPVMPHRLVRWRAHGMLRVLVRPREQVGGYVYHSEPGTENFEVAEAFAVCDSAYDQLLAYLLHETVRRGKREFIAALPPDDPFALFLRRFDARFLVMTRATGGGMARILSFRRLCDALAPVLKRRVKMLRREFVPRSVELAAGEEHVAIELGGSGPRSKIEASLPVWAKLFFGYITLREGLSPRPWDPALSEVAEMLFPQAHAFMYLRDRF
jgi:predicted acetyltransferase